MPRPPAPLPECLGDVFRIDEARACGASSGRLRASDLSAPFRGVRSRRTDAPMPDALYPLDEIARAHVLERVRAHALLLPPHAFYTGETALSFSDFALLDASRVAQADLEVAVFAPHRALRRPGIDSVVVRPDLAQVTVVDGIRVASPATAWAMLGRRLTARELVKLGDAIVRIPRDHRGRRRPDLQRATPDQLRAAVDAGRRRGAERLRSALERISEHSMSMLETDWRENLRGTDVPQPELDVEVRDGRGNLLGIGDAAFPQFRVVVEIQGDHHRVSREQWSRDIEKHAAYRAEGWERVELTSSHIRGGRGRDVALVRDALRRHGWMP